MEKLKYGLIGAGGNAEYKHIQGYLELHDIEIVAICDIDRDKASAMADRHHIPHVYEDYQEMIDTENLDLVSVVTPNFLHAEITEYALLHGVHVHCEKPLSIGAEEARRIVKARDASGKHVMIGLNNRFTNEAIYLKKWIDAGNLGQIYSAKAGWIRRSGIPGGGTWFTNRERAGGGVFIDLGAHYMDLALYLMVMPKITYAAGRTHQNFMQTGTRNRHGYQGNKHGVFDVEDAAHGYLGLDNGASLALDFSWAANIEEDRFYVELMGTTGGASLVNGVLKLFGEKDGICLDVVPKLNLNPYLQLNGEFRHFVECIRDPNKTLIAPAEHGLYVAEAVDAFYESAATGLPVILNTEPSLKSVR